MTHPNRSTTSTTQSAAQSIIAAYNTDNIRAFLLDMPERIQQAKEAYNAARRASVDADNERKAAEADLAMAIAAETDDKGKAKYGNVEARTAELTRRKVRDRNPEGYYKAHLAARNAEAAADTALTEYERQCDRFKSYRYIARLIAAEILLLADDDEATDTQGTPVGTGSDKEDVF
jgi:hypothetical protein